MPCKVRWVPSLTGRQHRPLAPAFPQVHRHAETGACKYRYEDTYRGTGRNGYRHRYRYSRDTDTRNNKAKQWEERRKRNKKQIPPLA
jgi:hypothetical protein